MEFKKWFKEDEHDLYNYPEESMQEAFKAGSESMRDKAVEVAEDLIASHKKSTEGECDNGCDFLIAWETISDKIKLLKE